jgi:hypothetical protein
MASFSSLESADGGSRTHTVRCLKPVPLPGWATSACSYLLRPCLALGRGASKLVHAASGRSGRRKRSRSRRASRRTRSSITLAERFSLGRGVGVTDRTRYRRVI